MLVSPPIAVFNCSASAEGFAFPLGNARTNRANCACDTPGEKWMLAIPEDVSSCAKLRSPADEPIGTPSSKIWCPEAPSSTPLPPLSSSAWRSSFHVVSNCAVVFMWPNSYSRANFSRMFKLRTNALAPPCDSGLMVSQCPGRASELIPLICFLMTSTLHCHSERSRPTLFFRVRSCDASDCAVEVFCAIERFLLDESLFNSSTL
jgi:hypothetical protein